MLLAFKDIFSMAGLFSIKTGGEFSLQYFGGNFEYWERGLH